MLQIKQPANFDQIGQGVPQLWGLVKMTQMCKNDTDSTLMTEIHCSK